MTCQMIVRGSNDMTVTYGADADLDVAIVYNHTVYNMYDFS